MSVSDCEREIAFLKGTISGLREQLESVRQRIVDSIATSNAHHQKLCEAHFRCLEK